MDEFIEKENIKVNNEPVHLYRDVIKRQKHRQLMKATATKMVTKEREKIWFGVTQADYRDYLNVLIDNSAKGFKSKAQSRKQKL